MYSFSLLYPVQEGSGGQVAKLGYLWIYSAVTECLCCKFNRITWINHFLYYILFRKTWVLTLGICSHIQPVPDPLLNCLHLLFQFFCSLHMRNNSVEYRPIRGKCDLFSAMFDSPWGYHLDSGKMYTGYITLSVVNDNNSIWFRFMKTFFMNCTGTTEIIWHV